jgi:TIR domain
MTSAFISYSHVDEELRNRFETHLAMLKRDGHIDVWHDRQMLAGDIVDVSISRYLEEADLIIALVSPEYLASTYCYERELAVALERQSRGQARLVCVILRPCDWKSSPLSKGLVTPRDGKPVETWTSTDEAFLDVTSSLRAIVGSATGHVVASRRPVSERLAAANSSEPRSSNLRIRADFTQVQKDRYFDDTYSFIRRYFENSLEELSKRNAKVEFRIRDASSQEFLVNVYRDGSDVAQCSIFISSGHSSQHEICFSPEAASGRRSYQGSIRVEADDVSLYLTGGAFGYGGSQEKKLTMEGAAEQFWEMLIERLR